MASTSLKIPSITNSKPCHDTVTKRKRLSRLEKFRYVICFLLFSFAKILKMLTCGSAIISKSMGENIFTLRYIVATGNLI